MKNIIEKSREFALSEIEKYNSPSLVHFELSEKKGIELAEKLGAHVDLVKVGTYLMDVKLGQAIKEGRPQDHVEMSVSATEDFLNQFKNLDDESKEKIINCVAAHHGTVKYKSLEAEICANADCYRFIHPRGFLSYYTILGKRFDDLDKILEQSEKKLEEKYSILSLDICKQELGGYYNHFKQFITDARN